MKAKKDLLTLSVLILANGSAGSHPINFTLFAVVIVYNSVFFIIFFFLLTTEVIIATVLIHHCAGWLQYL